MNNLEIDIIKYDEVVYNVLTKEHTFVQDDDTSKISGTIIRDNLLLKKYPPNFSSSGVVADPGLNMFENNNWAKRGQDK